MHDIMRNIDHEQWARDSCAASLIPDDPSKELNVALDMVNIVALMLNMMTMMSMVMWNLDVYQLSVSRSSTQPSSPRTLKRSFLCCPT
jgi:hypothetical protein